MKSKRDRETHDSLDDLYHRIKGVESHVSGLASLFLIARPAQDQFGEDLDLAGVGSILESIQRELQLIAAQVSEHALIR